MDWVFYVLLVLTVILLIISYRKDPSLPLEGLESGFRTLVSILPLLLVSFALSGVLRVLIPDELISSLFSGETGLRGLFIGTGAGMLTPGGPFVCYPIALTLYQAGAGIGPVISYVTGWALLGIFRVPFEVAIIGPKFAILRLVSSLILAPIAGYIAGIVYRFAVRL